MSKTQSKLNRTDVKKIKLGFAISQLKFISLHLFAKRVNKFKFCESQAAKTLKGESHALEFVQEFSPLMVISSEFGEISKDAKHTCKKSGR